MVITNIADLANIEADCLLVNNRDFLAKQGFKFVEAIVKHSETLGIAKDKWIFDIGDNIHLMEDAYKSGFTKMTSDLQGEYKALFRDKAEQLGIEIYTF
ncbi:MAG: hypothetical protein BGO27_02200 [Alphaproteobacteria bacterium 33-17]|nr:MAG: hypothetical protein BGO27_02200 [Alphaproteobacteria bacterium 33-17]